MLKFSVVIPIYNAEKTLLECVDSIMNQNYNNLELILVNDGSKDKSLDVCLQIKDRDSRVIVIDKQNEGVARARNDGLHACSGDYVYFVDPDDYIESNLFSDISKILKNNEVDAVVFGHRKKIVKNTDTYIKEVSTNSFIVKDNIELKKQHLTKMYLDGVGFSAWDKVINVNFLKKNNIVFPLLKRGQDMAFCANVFEKSNSIICLDNVYYNYIDINSTNNNKIDPNIIENHEYIFNCLSNIFIDNITDFYKNDFLKKIYIKWFFYVIPSNILKSKNDFNKKRMQIKKIYYDDFSNKTLKNYKLKYAVGIQDKIMLMILKSHSFVSHYLLLLFAESMKTSISKYRREK